MDRLCPIWRARALVEMDAHLRQPDLTAIDGLPSEQRMRENWENVFGSTPDKWEETLSVLSYFPREKWSRIKANKIGPK